MFIDVFIYTLCTGFLGSVLYIFYVFFHLLRLKKVLRKHWSYLDIQYHHRHEILAAFFIQSKDIPDIQSHLKPLEQLYRQTKALNKKVEVSGGIASPFFKELLYQEKNLKGKLAAFIDLFHQAPESEIKQGLSNYIQKLLEIQEKEEECKKLYNQAAKRLFKYQKNLAAKKLSKRLKMPATILAP